ncbi:MAG: hypothetical protein V3U92_01435 [Cellulophaga sp.]
MNIIPIHEYLGKNIDEILEVEIEEKYKLDSLDRGNYYKIKKINNSLYTKFQRSINFHTNSNSVIDRISIRINGEFPIELYKDMCAIYGNPDKILKNDKLVDSRFTDTDENGLVSTAYAYSLKECNFNKFPDFIYWKKDNYTIECTMKRSLYDIKSQTSQVVIRFKSRILSSL